MQGHRTTTARPNAAVAGTNGRDARRTFVASTILARKGRYDDAVRLLQAAREAQGCSRAEGLDLLARIYVQQGRHLDAELCWREAKRLDQSNSAYDHALERLRRSRLAFPRPAQMAVAGCALLALALLVWQVALSRALLTSVEALGQPDARLVRSDEPVATSQNVHPPVGNGARTGLENPGASAAAQRELVPNGPHSISSDAGSSDIAAIGTFLAGMKPALAFAQRELAGRVEIVDREASVVWSNVVSTAAELAATCSSIAMLPRQPAAILAAARMASAMGHLRALLCQRPPDVGHVR